MIGTQLNKSVKKNQTNRLSENEKDELNNSNSHGLTRKSIRDANNQCTFNHLFEFNFEFDKQFKQEIVRKSLNQADSSKSDLDQMNDDKKEYSKANEKDDKQERIVEHSVSVVGSKNAKNEKVQNLKNAKLFNLDWPYFEIRVWAFDRWKRKQFIGLAFFNLPEKPGSIVQTLNIWSLNSNHPKTKLMQFFLGYSMEPKTRLTVFID